MKRRNHWSADVWSRCIRELVWTLAERGTTVIITNGTARWEA